jgi:hypothetical protein
MRSVWRIGIGTRANYKSCCRVGTCAHAGAGTFAHAGAGTFVYVWPGDCKRGRVITHAWSSDYARVGTGAHPTVLYL